MDAGAKRKVCPAFAAGMPRGQVSPPQRQNKLHRHEMKKGGVTMQETIRDSYLVKNKGRELRVTNVRPVLSAEDCAARKRQIGNALFSIFSRYA